MKNAMFMIIIYNDWKNDVNNKSFSSFYKEQKVNFNDYSLILLLKRYKDIYKSSKNKNWFIKLFSKK
jgi:hypothetical protein